MIARSFFALPLAASFFVSTAIFAQTPAPVAEAAASAEEGEHCGFSPAAWFGGDEAGSVASGLDTGLKIDLSGAGPFTRAFKLEEAAAIRLEAATKASGDPVLRLYTASGQLIAENDDALGSLNSQITEPLEAGTYCLQADDLRGAAELTVQIGPESTEALLVSHELVCGPETEAQLFGGEGLEAAIAAGVVRATSDASGNGYLRFTLASPASFSLTAEGGAGIDPRITLFDAEGRAIASNDDADGLSARLDFQPELAAGSYCLGVRGNEYKPGTIAVSAEKIDIESFKRRAYARGQLVPLSGDHPVQALRFNPTQGELVLQGAEVTWFSFELKETSLVGIRSHGTLSGADTVLRLFGGNGELIVENDDQESDRNARIAPLELAPGKYFLALSDHQASGALGSPLRPVSILAERFIRAPAE